MADDRLLVLMHDRRAGQVTLTGNGRLRLDYSDAWIGAEAATPLSVSLPRQIRRHGHKKISPWMWGLLPDNQDVRRRWAREYQVSASSAFKLLGTPVGLDCAGAVQFAPPDTFDPAEARAGSVEWLSEDEIAHELAALRRDNTAWHGARHLGRFSLAGAQAKTAVRYDPDHGWGRAIGSEPTNRILKPASDHYDDLPVNEHLCLTAARNLGIAAARTEVRTFAAELAIVAHRYDRATQDGRLVRVHQEDLCQALSVHPNDKYQSDGGPSPEDIIALLRHVLPSAQAETDVRRFVDALAFNWLIGGTDAHGKNYGLLLEGQKIRLAPLYDIASFLPYTPDPLSLKTAMKIGDEYRMKAQGRRNWEKLAEVNDIDGDRLVERVRHLGVRVADAFSDAAGTVPGDVRSDLPSSLVDSVAEWADRCVGSW